MQIKSENHSKTVKYFSSLDFERERERLFLIANILLLQKRNRTVEWYASNHVIHTRSEYT